ncbi:DUF5053 domain-containing protein [uncultured Bacteroides sp.]|uniref:DUF5053 domain-containing protein n=1 Tax=uncultured Bacteroides sp. TaxID=162156 RepID=UPI002597B2FE|nr:DUF5053 domain-containing protein [uncultured Bacteroides sp.]
MTLHEELSALIPMLGTDSPEFYGKVKSIASRYNSDDDKKTIADFISGRMQDIDNRIDTLEEKTIRLQMQEVSDVISLSYLAKHYFNKSRSWLYQRMNGNLVNGKPARFTDEELATLNRALKDISEKLGSLSISY